MTLTFYGHPLSSYCQKVLIALYENDTPFAWRVLGPEDPGTAEAFSAKWPMAKMPLLVDGERAVAESSIIIEYLDHHHPGPVRMVPAETDRDAALGVRFMDRFFDNYVMTPVQTIVSERIRPAGSPDPYGVEQARAALDKAYAWLDAVMATRDWAEGGAFSLADCAAAPALLYARYIQPFGEHAHVAAYHARLEARPSVARTREEAEPYFPMFPFSGG
jgi:glutathione S-transferase